MPTLERTVERREFVPVRRVSWGAIFGGAALASAIMVVLGMLGVAVGATTLDPGPGDSPSAKAFGIGAGLWWLVSGILAVLAGGWVAGRLSGLRRRLEGPLHGLITWALGTVVTAALMTTVIGMLISGAFRVIGTTASAAASGTAAAVSEIGSRADAPDVEWARVWREAKQLLRETETPELQPEDLRKDIKGAARDVADADLESALSRIRESARDVVSGADQEAAVNVLVARTDMSEAEARKTVKRWTERLQSAYGSAAGAVRSTAGQVQRTATTAARKTVDAVSSAAWWTFFYLILTAAAAALGGFLGAPRHVPVSRRTRTTET